MNKEFEIDIKNDEQKLWAIAEKITEKHVINTTKNNGPKINDLTLDQLHKRKKVNELEKGLMSDDLNLLLYDDLKFESVAGYKLLQNKNVTKYQSIDHGTMGKRDLR